jgi:hypothetical protein
MTPAQINSVAYTFQEHIFVIGDRLATIAGSYAFVVAVMDLLNKSKIEPQQ